MTTKRAVAPPSTLAPLTPAQLRDIASELRRHAGQHAETETQMTKYLDRADELRAEACALEEREKLARWYANHAKERMRGR